MRGEFQRVALWDVLGEKPAIDVDITIASGDHGDDGVLVNWGVEQRVVFENHEGKPTVHIWATRASVGHDPTHTIELEL